MGELKENIVVGHKCNLSGGRTVTSIFTGEIRKKKPVRRQGSVMDRVTSDDGMIKDIYILRNVNK